MPAKRQLDADAYEAAITARQIAFARKIGQTYCGTENLKPLGRPGYFGGPIGDISFWYQERICDIAWWAVAEQLGHHPTRTIIDHAWLIGYGSKPHEPWALVTEPYLDADTAQQIATKASNIMEEWRISVHVLPSAESTWNPGHCQPLIAVLAQGCLASFITESVPWLLQQQH